MLHISHAIGSVGEKTNFFFAGRLAFFIFLVFWCVWANQVLLESRGLECGSTFVTSTKHI